MRQELSAALGVRVNVNAYLTPPCSSGFNAHYDTHDVFVLQTAGVKKWRIYHSPIPLPLPSQSHIRGTAASVSGLGDPALEVELQTGDMLYVPRGFLHHASPPGPRRYTSRSAYSRRPGARF
jgi:bifunctional lysine-specific demethylase and histidyl-hydroxylase NO66